VARAKAEEAVKTNAMRELDRAGVAYRALTYQIDDEVSVGIGTRVAEATGADPDSSLKTLVCVSPRKTYAVFCLPVSCELDLKKAARAAGEKSLALLPWRELPALTGYVRGGTTPIGMKKPFPTFIDETAQLFDEVSVSGGRIGLKLVLAPDDLASFCHAAFVDLVE
jgi:Cys-tRNA(Pro)/Cys-tRNA(Cys) deacylase